MTQLLKERFEAKISYEPMSGCWLWAGATRQGYGAIKEAGKHLMAHRLSWVLVKGSIPDEVELDHICRNRACVNPEHLRLATGSQNQWNTVKRRDNVSGFKGVELFECKWRARIQAHGIRYSLGLFDSPELAHAAYREAAIRLHSEFANFG